MKKNRKLVLQIIAGLIMAFILVYGVVGIIVYSSVGRFPSDQPTPRRTYAASSGRLSAFPSWRTRARRWKWR